MSRSRPLAQTMVGVIAVGALLTLAACTPEPEPTPTATATAAPETPEPEPYSGPLHFTGDELDWFLLTADEIAATIPGADEIAAPSASLIQISDGFGTELDPEICVVFLTEASLGSVSEDGAMIVGITAEDGTLRREYRIVPES